MGSQWSPRTGRAKILRHTLLINNLGNLAFLRHGYLMRRQKGPGDAGDPQKIVHTKGTSVPEKRSVSAQELRPEAGANCF